MSEDNRKTVIEISDWAGSDEGENDDETLPDSEYFTPLCFATAIS